MDSPSDPRLKLNFQHGLPARFKPCPQLGCVECLAHNLPMYTNRKRAYIAPSLSWHAISEIALRLAQPLLTTDAITPSTEHIFQENISILQQRVATLALSEKLLRRVEEAAIGLLQWHTAHYFMLGKNAICVLPRLHWTQIDSDRPRVDQLATGTMIADNVALSAGKRYPFIAVYCTNMEDTRSVWSQLSIEQQHHSLNSYTYLRSFRHAVHRGFEPRCLPRLSFSEDKSSGDEEEEATDDDESSPESDRSSTNVGGDFVI